MQFDRLKMIIDDNKLSEIQNKNILIIKIAFIIQSILISIYLLLLSLIINATSQIFVLIFGIVGLITYIKNSKKITA